MHLSGDNTQVIWHRHLSHSPVESSPGPSQANPLVPLAPGLLLAISALGFGLIAAYEAIRPKIRPCHKSGMKPEPQMGPNQWVEAASIR